MYMILRYEQKAHGGAGDRRGQQKCSVRNAGGPYQTIRNIMSVFEDFNSDYKSLRSGDLCADSCRQQISLLLAVHAHVV